MDGWNACTQDPHWLVRQIECHPSTVMVIQAIALFGAIAAAIGGPLYVAYCERRRRARLIVESMAVDYFTFRLRVETLSKSVRDGGFREATPRRAYSDMLNELRLELPESFINASERAIEADPGILRPCMNLIRTAALFNGYVDEFVAADAQTAEFWPDTIKSLASTLNDVRESCARAWPHFANSPDPVPEIVARVENEK